MPSVTADNSDVQVVSASGPPAVPLRLSSGPDTTGDIGSFGTRPATSFVQARGMPNETAGDYDVSISFDYDGVNFTAADATTAEVVRLRDAAANSLLHEFTLDMSKAPSTWPGRFQVPGQGYFLPLGTFSFPRNGANGPAISVEYSGPADGKKVVACTCRVALAGTPVGGEGEVYINGNDGSETGGPWTTFYPQPDGNILRLKVAVGTGTSTIQYPTAAGIQSALEALPAYGPGNVAVMAAGTAGPWMIAARGAKANQTLPTLVANDPAFTVLHDGTGGSVVGGPAVPPVATIDPATIAAMAAAVGAEVGRVLARTGIRLAADGLDSSKILPGVSANDALVAAYALAVGRQTVEGLQTGTGRAVLSLPDRPAGNVAEMFEGQRLTSSVTIPARPPAVVPAIPNQPGT